MINQRRWLQKNTDGINVTSWIEIVVQFDHLSIQVSQIGMAWHLLKETNPAAEWNILSLAVTKKEHLKPSLVLIILVNF